MPHRDAIDPGRIRSAWRRLRSDRPSLSAADGARLLGITEAELVACHTGWQATRLVLEWEALLRAMEGLGVAAAITANEHATLESTGRYRDLGITGASGRIRDAEMELRFSFKEWETAFAVVEPTPRGVRRSLQFFSADGRALHKALVRDDGARWAFETLTEGFAARKQSTKLEITSSPDAGQALAGEIDPTGLRAAWERLQEPHAVDEAIRRLGLPRGAALPLLGEAWAQRVGLDALRLTLEIAALRRVPVALAVSNAGLAHRHTAVLENVHQMGAWLAILDPTVRLHLRTDAVTAMWLVRKPSPEGLLPSVEAFDALGEPVLRIQGVPDAGPAALARWCALAEEVCLVCPADAAPPPTVRLEISGVA